MTVRAIAFLFFAAASCPDAPPEALALRVTHHNGNVLACGEGEPGKATRVRTSTTILAVEEHAFVLDACPANADCHAPMRTRVELSGGSVGDLRRFLAPGPATFELDVQPGSPCRWSLAVLDAAGTLLRIEDGKLVLARQGPG
ncbi:MAG TPA: hypothetical protein VGF28_02795 [Thermoanaerobaculia bacterium]